MDSKRCIRIASIDPKRLAPFGFAKGVVLAGLVVILRLSNDKVSELMTELGISSVVLLIASPIIGAFAAYLSAQIYNLIAAWNGGIHVLMEDVEEARRESKRRNLADVFPERTGEMKTSWYVVSTAGKRGPYSTDQVSNLIREGGIDSTMDLNRVMVNESSRETVSTVTQSAIEFKELRAAFDK